MLVWSMALAASWSVGEPLRAEVDPSGALRIPAGQALRLVADPPDAALRVVEQAGDLVPTRGLPDGLLVPAAGELRMVRVEAAPEVRVEVLRSEGPQDATAWERWERAVQGALRTGAELPEPPWGGARLTASIRLRARALSDRGTLWLGVLHDVEAVRPFASGSHTRGVPVVLPAGASRALRGPGLALVRTQAPVGPLVRFALVPVLDGVARAPVPLATAGGAPVLTRVWIPPGAHTLSVSTGDVPCEVTVEAAPIHRRVGEPSLRAVSAGPLDDAERSWLDGDLDAARAGFLPFADDTGAAGELARVRLLLLARDEAEAARFAAAPDVLSADGAELRAEAILTRHALLDPATVLDAAMSAQDPDVETLAAWMDTIGGLRPRGMALLEATSPEIPRGPAPVERQLREAALGTRWTRLPPREPASGVRRFTTAGPGVPRVELRAGETATVTLPAAPGGRASVLRLFASGEARYTIDDIAHASPGGELDVALTAGPHTLAVTDGVLEGMDADYVIGGTRVYESEIVPLPQVWDLPDPGVLATVRVAVDPPSPVLLVFDDGRVERRTPGPDGSLPPVLAGTAARSVEVRGAPGAGASLSIRTSLPMPPEEPPLPELDEQGALRELRRLTLAIDGGVASARLTRARVLGQLGLLTAARRDLVALVDGPDPSLGVRAARLSGVIAPEVPSAAAPGPHTVAAALSAAGLVVPAPDDADALSRLAAQANEPWLWVEAASRRASVGDLAGALRDLAEAGPVGADLAGSLDARTSWQAVTRADRGAGLVPVALTSPPPAPDAPLWRRAADEMLAAPWDPAEGLILHGGGSDLIAYTGTSAEAEILCRDETGPGRACPVRVRFDGTSQVVEIADGESARLAFVGPRAAHELEIDGPGPDAALVVRVHVDGAVLPPRIERLALRVSPPKALHLTLARPGVLRVEALRGQAHIGPIVARPGAPLVLPMPGEGAAPLTIEGDGEVLLSVGTLLPARDAAPLVPPAPAPAALPLSALEPLLARRSQPASATLRTPGHLGSLEGGLAVYHELLTPPVEPWDATEAEVSLLRGSGKGWAGVGAWGRLPGWAAGASAEGGRTWAGGWASARAQAGWGTGVVGSAGGASATGRARHDVPVTASSVVRSEARLAAGWWSVPAPTPVDPRAWSAWSRTHPVTLSLLGSWVTTPWRDVQAEVGARATSNTGPSLDSVGAWGALDVGVGEALVVGPTVTTRWRFADRDRATPGWWTEVKLGAQWGRWFGSNRVSGWAEGAWIQGGVEARGGVTVLVSGGRGLRDVPPGREIFRTARGMP